MKIKCIILSGILSVFFITTLSAQDKKTSTPEKAAPEKANAADNSKSDPSAKEMETWMAYMTPGDMHKMLASFNGDWRQEIVFWMDPAGPPTKAESFCTNSMIFDNRYQESITKGEMMGMPFEGKSLTGYDNAKKVFQSTWIDNMGSGIMFMEGPYDEKTKTINFTGTMVDPASGKSEKIRETFKFVDDNTQVLEMYATKAGKEVKTMEIKFTRQ